MSEHHLNTLNRAVLERAQTVFSSTGDLGEAIREAVIAANEEVQHRGREIEDPLFNRDVVNVLYCNRPLVPVN